MRKARESARTRAHYRASIHYLARRDFTCFSSHVGVSFARPTHTAALIVFIATSVPVCVMV